LLISETSLVSDFPDEIRNFYLNRLFPLNYGELFSEFIWNRSKVYEERFIT
jgi:hypothetical protein